MLGHLGIATAVVLLGRHHLSGVRPILIVYAALALFVLGCAAAERRMGSRAVRRVRTLHPLVFVGPLFAVAGQQARRPT
ncbi:hypothetical protein [Streptomyces sp. XH2]|uniref:hypothetical protein n=1 Tax=Streptomyces sp. XH2 TaxID=3412483 RepID=UPI003C7B4BA0